MINVRTIQIFLRDLGLYSLPLDDNAGQATLKGIFAALMEEGVNPKGWVPYRQLVGIQQVMFLRSGIGEMEVGPIDGYAGPRFEAAFRHFQDLQRIAPMWVDDEHLPKVWPRQVDVESFYGPRGTNQVKLTLPYPMVLDWDPGQTIRQVTVHKLVSDSLERALFKVRDVYGKDVETNGLNRYGGTLNVRKMTGSTTKWSLHSWGCAIDIWPSQNKYEWTRAQAKLALPKYEPFWQAFEAEGWVSLGRERDHDFMHCQAARL